MERRSQPLPFLKISWGGEEKKKKSKMKSKNDSRMGTPLQSSCRSEACSPCVGPKELLRRQIPLSARASPRAGHTLPWHAARCCSALSTHSSAARAPLRSSSALGAPVLSIQVHTSKQTARGAEEIFTKKKKKKLEEIQWVAERDNSLYWMEVRNTWRRCSSKSDCGEWASFSGSPLEEIPHTVMRVLVDAARSGLPANSAGAAQRRAGCRLLEQSARGPPPKPDTDLQIHWLGVGTHYSHQLVIVSQSSAELPL